MVLTVVVVVVRLLVGDAADHTFQSVLDAGLQPAAVLLPVLGILLVTSEWSQRTGLITFALVPVRSRILGAKLIASLLLAPAPAIVLLFALPTLWMAVVSLPVFSGVAPWVDYARALGGVTEDVMSATQWAHLGTSLVIWMVLPLLIGARRITRREIAS